MIIRKAMYGCGLYFFIKLAYNSPILCKFAWKQAFEIELMLFDVIAYKQIHPHYLWVSAFHDKLNS